MPLTIAQKAIFQLFEVFSQTDVVGNLMWTSSNISTRQKEFDFTSSGQGLRTCSSLITDNDVLINMIEELEGHTDENLTFQFLVCESCGYTHCEPGNWVTIRQLDDYILFVPAFDKILEEPGSNEYQPPYWFKQKGAFRVTTLAFEKLKEKVPAFKDIEQVKMLSVYEAISLYKWDIPHRMFGEFPTFGNFQREHILATSELNDILVSRIISEKLSILESASKIHLQPIDNVDEVVSVYLGGKDVIEWKAICKTPNGYELLIGDDFKLSAERLPRTLETQ